MSMTRNEMIDAVTKLTAEEDMSEEDYLTMELKLRQSVPHVDILKEIFSERNARSPVEIVDDALRLEHERKDDPLPPRPSHDDLVETIAFLQDRWKLLGSTEPETLVVVSLEFPNADVRTMIWHTHADTPPEQIVAEIYRRERAILGPAFIPPPGAPA